MNTPAQCGVIKPPKTDIYSEAPQVHSEERVMIIGVDPHKSTHTATAGLPRVFRLYAVDGAGVLI